MRTIKRFHAIEIGRREWTIEATPVARPMGEPSPANTMCPPQISSSAAPISGRIFSNALAYKTCGISSHDSKRRANALSTNCMGNPFDFAKRVFNRI